MARVLLGDVAGERKEQCKTTDRDRYPVVGLEHLIPQEIKLTEWSEGTENTFTKMFRKGDVLFGRRRAYLKKAAVAPFDGICSGDITVIQAIPQKILPELLPFVIQNETFFDFAVGGSAGSLSPRVKWEHLRNYEFELPEVEKQRELGEVLWAIYDTLEAYKKLLVKTDELVKARFVEMFGDPKENLMGWNMPTVQEAVDSGIIDKPLDGNHGNKHPKAKDYVKAGIPFIMANNICDGNVDLVNCAFITESQAKTLDKGFAHDGDVLLTHKGTIGRTAILHCNYPFVMLTPQVTYYRPLKMISAEFLKVYFDSYYFQQELMNIAISGTTRAYIGITAQLKLKLLVPDIALQNEFVAFVHQTDKSKQELKQAITDLEATYKQILSDNLT